MMKVNAIFTFGEAIYYSLLCAQPYSALLSVESRTFPFTLFTYVYPPCCHSCLELYTKRVCSFPTLPPHWLVASGWGWEKTEVCSQLGESRLRCIFPQNVSAALCKGDFLVNVWSHVTLPPEEQVTLIDWCVVKSFHENHVSSVKITNE